MADTNTSGHPSSRDESVAASPSRRVRARDRRGVADRALGRGVGYARRHGVLGDVRRINGQRVSGITHAGRPFSWKRGPDVELIEFGSFNPDNDNYEEGGRVVGH